MGQQQSMGCFHLVRKKGEIEVWLLRRVIIPPVGR